MERAVRRAAHPAAAGRHGRPTSSRRWRSSTSVGFPVLVRPSYVLGGRAMQIVHDAQPAAPRRWPSCAGFGSLGREGGLSAERPVLIDRFLDDAVEVDVDAVRDHTGEVLIGGVMEHVEEAGVHSGDSACAIPPPTLPSWVVEVIEAYTAAIAERLDVRGLINVQYAVRRHHRVRHRGQPAGQPHGAVRRQGDRRAAGQGGHAGDARGDARRAARRGPAAAVGARRRRRRRRRRQGGGAAVLPLPRGRPGARARDALDRRGDGHRHARSGGRSTRPSWPPARCCRRDGTVFLSLADRDKPAGLVVAKRLRELGLGIVATQGTADYLARFGEPGRRGRRQGVRGDAGGDKTRRRPDRRRRGRRSSSTRPQGSGGRTDGEQIRKAAIAPRRRLRDDGQRRARRRAGPRRAARPTARRSARCKSTTPAA